MRHICALALAIGLPACGNLSSEQQAKIQQALMVACNVDGVLVPVAQPVVATLGQAGAAVATADLLVHPEVVAACKAISGTPASVTPVGSPTTVSAGTPVTPPG